MSAISTNFSVFNSAMPTINSSLNQNLDVKWLTNIAMGYLNPESPFGKSEFIKTFRAEPDTLTELLPKEFYDFWYGPDPIYPNLQACEFHYPPVLKPEFVRPIGHEDYFPVGLETLEGLGMQFSTQIPDELKDALPSPSCWLVMRKESLAKNKKPSDQKRFIQVLNETTNANYEILPSIVDLACVVFARYITKGERCLGNSTGVEDRTTYSRIAESSFNTELGQRIFWMFGSFGDNGPAIVNRPEGFQDCCDVAITAIRKFELVKPKFEDERKEN